MDTKVHGWHYSAGWFFALRSVPLLEEAVFFFFLIAPEMWRLDLGNESGLGAFSSAGILYLLYVRHAQIPSAFGHTVERGDWSVLSRETELVLLHQLIVTSHHG